MQGHRLGEADGERLGDAADAEGGVARHGHAHAVVGQQPDVERGEGLHVGDGAELRHVDDLLARAAGRGEVDGGERRVRLEILEVHLAREPIQGRLDGRAAADRAVDGHGVALALRVAHDDAVDGERGLVQGLLRDSGDADENAGKVRERVF